MKNSRRSFLSLAGAGLAGGLMSGSLLARDASTECGPEIGFGTPSTTGPGRKFDLEGNAQNFPGNTILCHLNMPGQQFEALKQVNGKLQAQFGSENIAWLPPSSYHMTVFDGALDSRRRPGDWPHQLALNAEMDECNELLANRLKKFDLGFDPPIRMVADEELLTETRTWIPLRPVDSVESSKLESLRNRLSEATGIRHANHDSYGFHSTFGYYINQFPKERELAFQKALVNAIRELRELVPVIELGAPEYCLFDTMDLFDTQFFLSRK